MTTTISQVIKLIFPILLSLFGIVYGQDGMDTIVVRAEHFGIKGDGITDNTLALKKMVKRYANRNTKFIRIVFPTGEYLYSDNTWTTGLIYFRLEGQDSRFRNIYPDNPGFQGEDCMSLHIRGPHRRYDPTTPYTYNNGYKFKVAGQNTLELSENFAKFRRGDIVVLTGYEQQHEGYPPNPRYVEYHEIDRKQGKKLILTKKVENPFDDTWTDFSWGGLPGLELRSGAPRVLNLSRTDFAFPRVVQLRDISFQPNPNCQISDALVLSGEIVELQNVDADILYPSVTRVFRYISGNVREAIEFDKVVDSIYLENVYIHRSDEQPNRSSALAATSVNYLELKNCTIEGPLKVSPRHLFVNHSTFILEERDNGLCAIEAYGEWFPVYTVRVEAPEIILNGADSFCLIEHDFINSVNVTPSADASCLAIPDDPFNRAHALRSIAIGTQIRSKTDGTVGIVRNIRPTGTGNWCLMIDWDGIAPNGVDKIEWSSAREIRLHDISINPSVSKLFSSRRKQEQSALEILQKVHVED